jgi:hypothetical protein
VSDDDIASAADILPPKARELFCRQARQDQRHALAVYRTLCREGHTDAELLQAALLHDVGKAAAPLPAWQRAVIVLMDRFAPRWLASLGQAAARDLSEIDPGEPAPSLAGGWRRPLIAHAVHPEIGARWAEAGGCSALTVSLIRHHHDQPSGRGPEERARLAALRAADGRS